MKDNYFEFQPGTYFIGDPCYAILDDEWLDFLDKSGLPDDDCEAEDYKPFEFKGKQCWFGSTAHGDGTYIGNNGIEYSVDAGIIGVTPIELATYSSEEELKGLGSIQTFERPFFVSCEDGNFRIGSIQIDTSADDEDDY